MASSPALAGRAEFAAVANLGTIDVLAARLWLDQHIVLKNPSNVLAGFEPTTGATLFDLNSLQVESLTNRSYLIVRRLIEFEFEGSGVMLQVNSDICSPHMATLMWYLRDAFALRHCKANSSIGWRNPCWFCGVDGVCQRARECGGDRLLPCQPAHPAYGWRHHSQGAHSHTRSLPYTIHRS